jgi:hypothetical protein
LGVIRIRSPQARHMNRVGRDMDCKTVHMNQKTVRLDEKLIRMDPKSDHTNRKRIRLESATMRGIFNV